MTSVLELFKLNGKAAFVTGGAKGLGQIINEGLLEAGVSKLAFCGRGRHGSIEAEEIRLRQKFPERMIKGFTCDVTQEEHTRILAQLAKQGRLYLAFCGEDDTHRFTQLVPHDEQQWQYLDELMIRAALGYQSLKSSTTRCLQLTNLPKRYRLAI